MGSDNPVGADNQQERLISLGWVLGFVDGEGCFSISFVRQPHRPGRRGYRTGLQVMHQFVVTQGAGSARSLEDLHEFFGVGRIYVNRRHDNHRDDLHQYVVSGRQELLERVIPFFEAHPLRTAKRGDFHRFALCVRAMADGHHLSRAGLLDLVEIVQTMNRHKPRPDLIRILRGHTPEVRDTGS